MGACSQATTGGNVVCIGQGAGANLVGGGKNLILGSQVASTTLVGGAGNILIGTDNLVDTPGANTSDMLQIKRSLAGVTANAANNNNPSLCAVGMHCVLGVLRGANFNVTTDQSFPIWPANSNQAGFIAGASKYIVTDIYVTNCSTSLTTAKGALYTGASKTGTIIGATTTAFTNCTGATTVQRLTGLTNEDTNTFTAATLFLSLTTAQGGAATGDLYVIGIPIN